MPHITEAPGVVARELVSESMQGLVALSLLGHQAPPNVQRVVAQIIEGYQNLILFTGYALDEGPECLHRIEERVREGQREFALLKVQEADKHAGEVLKQMFQPQLAALDTLVS